MTRRLFGALVAGVLALLFAAPGVAAAQGHAVTMAHYAFSPASLTVHVGDSVTWTNQDQAPHDVTTTSAPVSIHSPTLSTGQSWTYTFTQPGQYSYYCSIHPDMRATVVVLPAQTQPTAAQAPAVGKQAAAAPSTQHRTTAHPITQADASAAADAPAASVAPEPRMGAMAQMAAPAQTTAPTTTLNPMLLVAGVAAGVTTLCLLLIGSRPGESS